ncbi:hypothetical protein BS17DRAFT_724751 [Gyrodon lividus]|nr:hypothetical protein BS17DRAFT_724751 [Gyrodon lividus]
MASSSRHSRFYMTTVIFLVEGCLLRVPRDPFESRSSIFRDMFLLPVGNEEEAEGLSDARPIRLEGVKLDDFEQLLKVLFPGSHGQQELPDGCAQWTSVLELATLWAFDHARKEAIEALAVLPITPVDKIVLATKYDIKDWMLPAINAMAQRVEPIGVEDVNRLGLDFALKIASVREQITLVALYRNGRHPTQELAVGPRNCIIQTLDFTPMIHMIFDLTDSATKFDSSLFKGSG